MAPATIGPQPPWAVPLQAFTFLGVGACFLGFVVTLLQPTPISRKSSISLWCFFLVGGTLFAIYGWVLVFAPWMYRTVRLGFATYGTIAVLGSLALLGARSFRARSPERRHVARLVLLGVGLGSLPFVAFVLIPITLGTRQLIPNHFAALFWGVIPVTLAYAILQHQLLGIRRLFHRGIVYGASSVILLLLISLVLGAITTLLGSSDGSRSFGVTVLVLVFGVVTFNPLTQAVRRFLGTVMYHDSVDYNRFIATMGDELSVQRRTYSVANLIASRLTEALQLESALVFVGDDFHHPTRRRNGRDPSRGDSPSSANRHRQANGPCRRTTGDPVEGELALAR